MNKLQQYKLKRGIGIGMIVLSAILLVLFYSVSMILYCRQFLQEKRIR